MKKLINERLNELNERFNAIMHNRGQDAMNDGDGWHDGAFVLASNEAEVISSQIRFLKDIAHSVQSLVLPENDEVVGVGHNVRILMTDDSSTESISAVIIPNGLTGLMRKHINNEGITVVSEDSPLSRAIINKPRGSTTSYMVNDTEFKIMIEDQPDAIQVYSLFQALLES